MMNVRVVYGMGRWCDDHIIDHTYACTHNADVHFGSSQSYWHLLEVPAVQIFPHPPSLEKLGRGGYPLRTASGYTLAVRMANDE